jgi:hypothetical protein
MPSGTGKLHSQQLAHRVQLRSLSWQLDGRALLCGTADGKLLSLSLDGSTDAQQLASLAAEEAGDGAELTLIRPLDDRRVLLGYHNPQTLVEQDPSYFAVFDRQHGAIQQCGSSCFPLGREEDGEPPPRSFHCVHVPEWRMAVVCSTDSDEVCSYGSRKPGEAQRWQRWELPDEEGPPGVPTFEVGDVFEDQFIMGLALDLSNEERLVLIAGHHLNLMQPCVLVSLSFQSFYTLLC